MTKSITLGPRFSVYKDRSGRYRWRLRAKNGRIIAASGESFSSKRSAVRSIATVRQEISEPQVVTFAYRDGRWEAVR